MLFKTMTPLFQAHHCDLEPGRAEQAEPLWKAGLGPTAQRPRSGLTV